MHEYPTIKQAQFCKDLEYMIKSIPYFKKIIIRRATQGTGKLSVGAISQWFKLDAEQAYYHAKEGLEKIMKAQMSSTLARNFEDARQVSWAPKLPFS